MPSLNTALKPLTSQERKCADYLIARGFLLHVLATEYWITNHVGGRVFRGSLVELKRHLKDTFYGEVIK